METLVAEYQFVNHFAHLHLWSCNMAQCPYKVKGMTDLELIKWSITRLLIPFNSRMIKLIVWARGSFSCPPTPPSFTPTSSFLPYSFSSSTHKLKKVSILIYFVSLCSLQKLVSFCATGCFNKVNLPILSTPLHLPHTFTVSIQHMLGFICRHTIS